MEYSDDAHVYLEVVAANLPEEEAALYSVKHGSESATYKEAIERSVLGACRRPAGCC